MSDNKTRMRRFFDAMSSGSLAAIDAALDEGYAENVVYHGMGDEIVGREGMRAMLHGYHTAFPDMQLTVGSLVEEGDMVVTRFTVQGTQTGEFQGQPPTGKSVRMQIISMTRMSDGQIVEEWEEGDLLGMLKQLGLVA